MLAMLPATGTVDVRVRSAREHLCRGPVAGPPASACGLDGGLGLLELRGADDLGTGQLAGAYGLGLTKRQLAAQRG